jgi:hypothetical protein
VLDMLGDGVVAVLPTIHVLAAEETFDIIRVVRSRAKEEAGLCKLQAYVRDTFSTRLQLGASYALGGNILVWPVQRLAITASGRGRSTVLGLLK